MRIDRDGNQIVETTDLIATGAGPKICRCGRWRAVKLDGAAVCAGCFREETSCECATIGVRRLAA